MTFAEISAMSERCFECGSEDVVEDYAMGDLICRCCGMVVASHLIDDGAEWRNYSEDDRNRGDQSRVGEGSDARLGETSASMYLVRSKPGSKTADASEQTKLNFGDSLVVAQRSKAISKIKELATILKLPNSIVESGIDLYAAVEDKNVFPRKSSQERDGVYAAILFIACRRSGNSRSFKEFEVSSGIDKNRIGRAYSSITKAMEIIVDQAESEDFIGRFCSALDLPSKTPIIAMQIVKKAKNMGLVDGKMPSVVAAGVIYLVAAFTNSKRSIDQVSEASLVNTKQVKEK